MLPLPLTCGQTGSGALLAIRLAATILRTAVLRTTSLRTCAPGKVGSDQVLEHQLDRFQVVIGIRIRRDGLSSDECLVFARPTSTADSYGINLRFYLWLQPSANVRAAWLRTPVVAGLSSPIGETTHAPGQNPLLDCYHLPGPRLRANESAGNRHAINRLKESQLPSPALLLPNAS